MMRENSCFAEELFGLNNRVVTDQEMVREKNFKVREKTEFYFECGKIDVLKNSKGKLK